MRIALLTDGISPYVMGGMQRHSFYLAKYFARQNIQVVLYHFNNSIYDINKLEFFSDDEKKHIDNRVFSFPVLPKLPGHYIKESYKYSELIFNDIKKELNEFGFIYAKGFTAWKLIEEKKKGLKCPPIGVNFHGYEMFQKAPDFKSSLQQIFFLRRPVKWIVNNADVVFSYGGKITDIIKSITKSQIIESPAGIEEQWINSEAIDTNPPLKFIYVGRYERRKGIEELNNVLKQLIGKNDFKFSFIGPIPNEKQIIAKEITYYGSITDSNSLKLLLREHDVLVCPSWSEGMPNVILEAMAAGLAIIASDVGACGKMVDEKNGILIQPANENILFDAIKKFILLDKTDLTLFKNGSQLKIKDHFLISSVINNLLMEIKNYSN